ncbi:hypothetical protein [Novosphingobium sp. M1R2S20]|uniref:Uncharacterized protein n=1 Tax=Novosphingobium rhizovicinum TaxID=3228928 RepID=A0ABV3REQ4_9SPHN
MEKGQALGAARLVLAMGLIGGAAGAVLAVTTIPAFSPYADRSAPPRAFDPPRVEAPAQEPSYELESRPERDDTFDSLRIVPGQQDGAIILELPQWTHEGMEWMMFARRALGRWQDLDVLEHGEREMRRYREDEPRHRGPDDWRHEPRYGYAVPREEQGPYGTFEEHYYSPPQRSPAPDQPPLRPSREPPTSAFDRAFPSASQPVGRVDRLFAGRETEDPATSAARRALEAAEDVRSAERRDQ